MRQSINLQNISLLALSLLLTIKIIADLTEEKSFLQELQLTSRQISQIETIKKENYPKLSQQQKIIQAQEEILEKLIREGKTKEVLEKHWQWTEQKAKLSHLKLTVILKIRAELQPEQKKKMDHFMINRYFK